MNKIITGIDWLRAFVVFVVFSFLALIVRRLYSKYRRFTLTLTIYNVQQQDHGEKHELMIPHILAHEDKERSTETIEIERITHEIGWTRWPRLKKITQEYGTHSEHGKLPITLKFNESTTGKITITYNMGKKIPEKCKLKTIVEHTYGTNEFTREITLLPD